jgi:hypothetical protein
MGRCVIELSEGSIPNQSGELLMKTQIQRRIPFLAASCALAAVVFPGTASSNVQSASVGGGVDFNRDSCWDVTWTGLVNTCGSPTAGETTKLVVPVPAGTWDSWSGSSVMAYGQYLQTGGAWVSCVGVSYNGLTNTYYVSNRGTTSKTGAQAELVTLGALTIGTNYSQYFDCDATHSGAVYYVEYH